MFYLFFARLLDPSPVPGGGGNATASLQDIANIALGIIGALCFLMIVIGGFKYTVSRGEPAEMAKAKDTIMYALIGLVVTLSAATIINFVVNRVFS